MKYLILLIRNFQKKYNKSFANYQNTLQIANCEWLIRTLAGKVIKQLLKHCLKKIKPCLNSNDKFRVFYNTKKM